MLLMRWISRERKELKDNREREREREFGSTLCWEGGRNEMKKEWTKQREREKSPASEENLNVDAFLFVSVFVEASHRGRKKKK